MDYRQDVKFILDVDVNEHSIGNAFNKAHDILNWQFDENSNAILTDGDVDYSFKDISNLKETAVAEIIDSFFDFTFDDVIGVPLYRFLVLKNNEKLTILANISSLIFDYSLINDFWELIDNTEKPLPKYNLDSCYKDVQAYLNSSDFENDSIYWKKYIQNSSKHIKFYNIKHDRYKSQKINPDNDSVTKFIKKHDCTLFDFYGSIFSLYLSRIDRLDGCLLKTLVPRKTDLQTFDKNTLFKVDVNQHESFNDLLNKFSSSFKNASNHTKVDVDNYLDEKTSYYAIYDFSEFNEDIHVYTGEHSALTLNIYENSLELIYNADLFSDIYIEHMAKNIENVIDDVLSFPSHVMGDIDILSDEEKSLLSHFCKGKSIEVEEDKILSHAFREHAIKNPNAIAVDDGINQITYSELERSSNSIANDLHENHEINPKSRIGLMLPRNYHFPELVLALNKIGAAYVPIDLSFPINRIEHMLNIAQAEHLITTKDIAQNLDLNVKIIPIEDLRYNDDVNVEILSKKDDLFAILFTSGTTGMPKGVMFYNRQFPWLCASFAEIFNISYEDIVGSYLSFSFIASFIIFITLYLGGCVRLFNENEQKNSLLLIKSLKETHMNSLILPPSIGMPIYENEDLKLDYLIVGGAKLNELSKKDRYTKLVNFYGTTEILFATSKVYDLKDIKDNRVSIGNPIANTEVYILDDNNNRMPLGVPGEICVSGGLISPGYLNNPKLTSKLFVDNPFSDREISKTMYRTGDIGFYNFDGEIEIIGREDDQLSVRGFRIESDEILNIMKSFEEISDIYLDVDNDTLTAYYTTSDNLDINEVKEALKIQLPYYMIPTLFIELEKIPLNMNGKIDKTSLKTDLKNENIEITDEVIKCVADTFKEVLNLDSVLIEDNFVSLGGTSLSAMKLQLTLKERLNVQLSSNEIINLSTPKNIGEHIKSNLIIHSTFNEDKYTFDDLCPLSESQLNVYLDESVNDMGTAYNNPFKIELKDNYSTNEIKEALIKLFDAFPILKARVLNENGNLSFAFDAEPEITKKSSDDLKTFVKPFELDKSLSRFSILNSENTIVLCADFHHLIFDGTSLNILLKKFISILNGADDVNFADNGILKQLSFEENSNPEYIDNAKKFFDEMLTDRDEVYELLPSVDSDNDNIELIDTFDIDTEYLNTFLKNHSITPNQFFTSVFAYTLSRFSGSDKVLFNLIEDGRGHIDLSESVGMFVKTLPVLMDCKNQDIDSYLSYSSDLINSVMKYDLYPFRVLANEYDLNSDILFQYSHNLFSDAINNEDSGYDIDELTHDLNADLTFDILNNGKNRLTIRTSYTRKYSKTFIEHFVESYKLILHEIIKVDELKDINYISNDDIELLDAHNQTENPLVYDDILDAFNDNLAKYPKNNLVTCKNNVYTYDEGAFIANKIANNLKDIGVNKDDNVAFLVERSELYLFTILGILSAGAAYVPLDYALPDERIKFMINDTDAKVVIVSNETHNRIKKLSESVNLLNISDITQEDIGTSSKLDVIYGDLACILYTSGTTGLPKGVKITRKSLINVAESYIETQGLNNNDVYGLFSAITFDVTSFVITTVICAGASLSVIPEEIRLNMSQLNEYLIEQNASHVFITTQVGKLFMQSVENTSLNVLLVIGEKLGEFESPKGYRLIDAYGPTEAFAYVSSIDNKDKLDGSSVGMLNHNTRAYILDDEFRRVPAGAVGELYLTGYQISAGYLNREKETEAAFINNPFDDMEGYEVLYRTGDMVRFLPDGSIGIVGRRDSQVKIRGNRVELTEIEYTIRNMENIEDVTVQTITNNGNNELIAYIVLSDEFEDDNAVDYVREYVSEHNPEYMVPSYVMELDNIPLNVNGKVDKRALPNIDLDSLHDDYVAPTTEDERVIVEAFEKIFIQKIGIYDDFIRLGGDSLTAIRIASHLENYNITAVDILSLHTPYAIAKNIKKAEYDLDIYNLENSCPLSESQLNVYLDIVSNNKYDAYNIPLFMEIPKEYTVNEICNALDKMLEVHPILSMHISEEFEVPYLIKGFKPPITIENNINENLIIEFLNKPFDLNESLCRFLIVNDNSNYKLNAVFNHIIFDALSYKVFKRDLLSILDGKLPNVDKSFLEASAFSQQIQDTDDYIDAEKFYESMLTDKDESGVLIESVDASEPGALQIDLDLNNDLLKSFLAKHSISENVLFTGAFAYTLSRFTGSEYASFNLLENGRDKFNNFDSIGMYINTLPLLVNCKNQNITSFIEHMASLIYDVMKYNYYPFRLLSKEYNLNSDILFQFLPEWINNEFNENIANTSEKNRLIHKNNMIADFIVEVRQHDKNYNLNITYCDKYSNNFAQHFATSYKLILQQLITVEKLDEIKYITKEDIKILDNCNQTKHPLNYYDILDAFNDNLAKYPKNNLITYKNNSFTYDEGAFIANKIANNLKSIAVEKDDNVAFLVERSEVYMFSILGILSAGAAYVPLDDALPDERIKFMIDDTNIKVLIVCDETYNRAKKLSEEVKLLNISNIIEENTGISSNLDVVYGDLACILYTSGTTSLPKGVKITRKSVLNLSQSYCDKCDFNQNDVYALYSNIGFDAGSQAILQTIYAGARLTVIPEDIKFNIPRLNEYFIKENVTHAFISTQVGKLFMEQIDNSSLKILSIGGEKFGEFESPKDYRLIDAYGPTETFAFISSIDNSKKIHHSSVGFLNYNTKAYILDGEFRRSPIGAIGELCLAGHQISAGYLNREKETDAAFINNPIDDMEGYEVLYRTGDMVRLLPDGSIGIVGRRDNQVKIRGNRVELTEIESTIRNMENIEDVTIQTITNNKNNELIAYIVLSEGSKIDNITDYIRGYVSKNKPEYMVPSYVIELDTIPLNVNGKVDMSALPDVDVSNLQAEYVAPTNETEKNIIEAFELVFNQKGIGLNDNFIHLGGDSITAIRVISMLEKNGITCTARDILNYKTPYLIAQNAENIESTSYDAVEGPVDLLPIQEHFFNQINKDDFSQHFILKSQKKLDITVLQESFDELCNVHDMLRAKYSHDENGKAIQEILPTNTQICKIKEHNITENIEKTLKKIYLESSKSLNIENNLIEINLIHYNNESYLMFTIHHLIIDGVSWNILITDLTHIYTHLKQGKEVALLRPYPYEKWINDIKKLVNTISPEEKQHWTKINQQIDDSAIKGDSKLFMFDVDVNYDSDNLLMLSEEEYWALAIARAYKKTYGKDLIFNRESHGRDESIAKLNRTIGWFTSQYPILTNTNNKNDDIPIMNDVYNIKTALKNDNHLGLNYSSLIYTTKELEFKHCPVTFNFLSSEFTFKNEIFESYIPKSTPYTEEINIKQDSISYGITFNIVHNNDSYSISGDYADNTFLGNDFNIFIENIKSELELLGNYEFNEDNIVCCLSESQLGVYLDEKVDEKDTAYSTPGIFEYCEDYTIDEVKDAIHALINKHPILKGRILDTDNIPLLICDSYPTIEIINTTDYSNLIKPFNLDKSLARFYILDNEDKKFVIYDMHHTISDATSQTIINNELEQALIGKLDDNVDLGFVYASRDSFESQFDNRYKSAKEFFHDEFSDIDAVQPLLTDIGGKTGSVSLPIRGIRENIEAFAQNNSITVGSLLNAVFAYTYSRFTGGDKVYYNFTEHGRHENYSENAVGMFIRTIPIIAKCENKSIKDYLTNMSDLIMKSMTNSIYPYRLLAREYNLNNNVAFEYNYNLNDFDIDNNLVVRDDADGVSDFLCVINDLEDGFVVTATHLDKFSQHTAKQFVKVFKEVLVQFLEKEKLEDINYTSNEDIKLLDKYNQTQHPLKYDDILDAFNDTLAKYPKNNLVTYKNNVYTYDEGAFIANEIANNLKSIGVEKDDNVAFLVERSELYMFSILAILSTGATYVPLDDSHPDERIKFMMDDTDAKVVIVCDETYNRAEELSEEIKLLNISDIIKEPIETSSKLDVTNSDLACILYTSGTTGVPKGVKITRKAIVNYIDNYVRKSKMTFDDVFALYASIGFDVGAIKSIFVSLYCGACLDIVPWDIRLDINKLNSHFTNRNVTHASLPTQVARQFINEVDNHSLDVLYTGGEKLGEVDYSCNYVLVDCYGPTEACVSVTTIEEADKIDSSSIGYLTDNLKAYVLDDEFRRVPIGAVGELYLAGYQIANGYLNRPEENTKSFINNPFDNEEGYETLYRTGDMVRLLPDGSIGIVGRRDNQVKIRGNRVELTEIESTIRNMENIEDVTIQTITNNKNNELIAYIVLSEGSKIDNITDYIRGYVSKNKPEYMVPSYVIELDTIPLNVNGKVDMSALPDVDVSNLQAEYVAPTNETEKNIIEAFELVFNQKGIGLNDNFIHLGGDSITAIRVISMLEKNGITCTARDILNYKTPYLIAQNAENIESTSYDAVEGPVDLLPIQEHFFNQINKDDFSQHFILKSQKKLDITVLQESFDELCNVHDMLRAKYSHDENGKAIQEILPTNTQICKIKEHNITENIEKTLKKIYLESSKSLNIENNLIEINLVHCNNESYLLFIIHHLIVDGVSWNILITDLTNIYTNLKQGKKIELLRPYPYRNWVEDVKDLAKNISYEEKQHWTKINQQIDESGIKGNTKLFTLDVDVNYDSDNLLMLSEEEYWALAIARAYKKTYGKELIFNRESHGRDESIAKLNRTIGWFTSQYPILTNTNNKNDDISIMNDVYNIKTALKDVDNLGLNYSSLIYTTKELEFKHCPVTFNFLSSEFTFKNEIFESYIPKSTPNTEEINNEQYSISYGITFNIVHNNDSYSISGDYADNTYIGDEFNIFIENIKSELEFLGNYEFNDNNIVCCLSESQLGIYLDEKMHEKDTAYSVAGIFEYGDEYTIDEVKDAIHTLIKKHPILKGRILDTDNIPLLICDSYPTIEIVNTTDYSNLIKPFNLDKSLARFYILDNEDKKFVIYDMHHTISDATSQTIINNELEEALVGKLDDNVDLGFVYASRDSFESQFDNRYKSAKEFFHDEFSDIDAVQPLLTDIGGKTGSVSLPIRGIRENIEIFAQNNSITVGSLLNAVFAYTYSRFTGGDKVYYNFTEHGRHENYSENAVGMFIRTIPIIAKCENKSIKDYLTNMSDLIMKSMTNSIYPYRLLAREYNLNNNVAFEYNYNLNDFDIDNNLVVRDDADGVSDFLCVINDLEDGFVVSISHLDKFSQHTAKQFVKVFKEVLIQFLEKEKLEDINYISNEDIKLLDSYNKTEHTLVYEDILDAFNDNLAKYPKNSLVTYKNNVYTYDEGAFIANKIANKIKNMGVKKEDNVAFLVERSELYMFSILAILSTGATYVPLEDTLPDERIKFMMDDTDAKVVIVCDETYNRVKKLSEEIKLLNISDIIKEPIGTSSKLDVTYGNLACILYTSGTTGLPKGVKITRKGILNLATFYEDEYGLSNDDVYGLFSTIGFDAALLAMIVVLYSGASLSVVPRDVRLDIHALNEYYINHGVTHTLITSQVGKLFMQSVESTSLDVLLVGGEKLGEFESPEDYLLVDAFGPTEATVFISSIRNSQKLDPSSIGSLGYNIKAYVLDNESRRVPIGAVGELYLAGYQVAEGYLNRDEENEKAFLDNPFDGDEQYRKMYRSGDVVRYLPDGSLSIVGRHDSQVKIRGNRVELSEVEDVIRQIEYLEDVTVQTTTHDGNNELVAYVVVDNDLDGEELTDEVQSFVIDRKPEYMIPSFVVRLDEIPLTVNDKVDKRALPDVDMDSLRAEYVAPRNENEKEIIEAFKKALNLEKVSIYDDFIRLGGDSLSAIKLLSFVKSNDVTMADIFTFRTPEAIAKNIPEHSFDLDIYSLEDGCPLNSAQINVFADATGYNKSNAYHVMGYIPISNEYGLEKILGSLDEILNMHPILSMHLSERYEASNTDVSNRVVLNDLIKTAKKFGTKKILGIIKEYGIRDIGGLYNMLRTLIRLFKGDYPYLVKGNKPPISVESKFDKDVLIDFYSESFDFYNYLSKFMIVESEDSYYLFYMVHHIIFDAVSAGVFKHDLMTLLDGGSIEFDDGFLKASAFTHQIKSTEKFDEAKEFYRPMLSNLDDVGALPEDNPSSEGYNMSTYNLEFDKGAFKTFLNNMGISENVLFTAVFSYALSQFVNGDKVIFTMIENGRDRFNENFIGMTSNVMPVVIDCKDQSINSFTGDVADTVYGVLRHSYYPTFLLYQKYDFEIDILFQFVPNWIADDYDILENSDDTGTEIVNHVLNDFNDFLAEFFVQVYQNGDDYRLIISHSNKYSQKMISDFKNTYTSILSNIINASLSSDLSTTLK